LKSIGWAIAALACLIPCASASIAIDANVSKDQTPAAATVTSPAFSTASTSELLLAFVATDYLSGTNTKVTGVTGAGLTWTLVGRSNAQSGSSEIWRAFSPSVLSGVSVKASLSQSVVASITVVTFSGADGSGTNGAGAIGATASSSAASGAPTVSLTTTRANSFVFGVGNDYDKAVARKPATGQSLVHQYLTPAGDTYWTQMVNGPVLASGTKVALSDTAPTADRYNLVACEILASTSTTPTWSLSGNISPTAAGSGAVVKLSGAASATTTANSSGQFSFTGLSDGNYSVAVTKSGYTFTPASEAVTISGADQTGISFSGAAVPTWSISGNISPAADGSGSVVLLSGTASAAATADSSGMFSFNGLANGSYTVTPGKSGYSFDPPNRQVTVNSASVSGLSFTAAASTSALAMDVKTSRDQDSASSTISSSAFTTTSGQELLLALISTDYLGGANTTVKSVSGGGLTWVLVGRANGQNGTSEIWRAFSANPLSGTIVTASLSQAVASTITVVTFVGADASGVNGAGAIGAVASASSAKGAPSASLVTTRANSIVIGAGNDFDNATARTPGPGQTVLHQFLSAAGDTYWAQMQTAAVPASGSTVTINDTAPTGDRYNLVICEVLSSSGTTVEPVPPTVTMTSPAAGTISGAVTLSATISDNVGIASLQFLLDGAPIGAALTNPPFEATWQSTSAPDGPHTLSAVAKNNANQTGTAPGVSVTVNNAGTGSVVGSWSAPVNLPAVAVNLILLRNNQVLLYQDGSSATVWNYANNTFTSVPIGVNLFCSGASLLADGRVFIAGGYGDSSSIGIADAEIFNPANNTWTTVPKMAYKRWYPTATTLADGRVLVTAGWQTTAHSNAGISEIYDPATNKWTQLTNANNPFETYPFLYQLSDGRVLHIGGSEYATDTDVLDINTQTWSVVDSRIIDGGSATMYAPGQFMKAGAAADSQDIGPGSNTTFVLDMTKPNAVWQQTAPMAYIRSFPNLTMLPDGTALVTGGESDKNGGDISKAVYAAELWSPDTKTWTTMASMHTPREYHGTALLLPDGRVMESGMGADFGNVPDEKSAEFFSPPYLFKGARPTITSAPTELQYNTTFNVVTPNAADIVKVSLIRTGAVTHFFDQNERYLPLTFQQSGGSLIVDAPPNANQAPPGYYMLFLVNRAGVPSIAPFVHFAGN
jgi:hypothetical protein